MRDRWQDTPFALSLVVGLFFAARKMAATPTTACPLRLEGVESSNFLRSALFLSAAACVRSFVRSPFVRRSFVRSSFVSAPPSPPTAELQPSLSTLSHRSPGNNIIPLYFPFPPPFLPVSPPLLKLTQRHWRELETSGLSSTLSHPLRPPPRRTPDFALSVLPPPPSSFSVSFFRELRFSTTSTPPPPPPPSYIFSLSLSLSQPPFSLLHTPLRLCFPSLFLFSRPPSPSRAHIGTRCSGDGRARILLRRTRMKFITNYGKSLDDRRAVRRPERG